MFNQTDQSLTQMGTILELKRVEPDFRGWEVKQHSVTNFPRADSGTAITLMTPEPTDGFYKDRGVEAFIRWFGSPD